MAKVLCLSSQVVWGPVGNTAAVPALQAQDHEVLQVPTILLSHHPGLGKPAAHLTPAKTFAELLDSVEANGALADCAAVMTGYFADQMQIRSAADLIIRLRAANPTLMVLVDPIIGDHGALYVPSAIALAIRDFLLPLATITTPNCFEVSWLTGAPATTTAEAVTAAVKLGCSETIITSIPLDDHQLGTLLLHDKRQQLDTSAKRLNVPHGTGDFLAGCYLAHRLLAPPAQAFESAMARLHDVINKSAKGKILRNT